MGGDRGQAVLTPLLRRQRHTIAIPVEFEPQDRSSEDAALSQIVPDPGFHGAEVLANHHKRNKPMTWSTRRPPACRKIVEAISRNGAYPVAASRSGRHGG